MKKTWTPADIAIVRRAAVEGKSTRECSALLGGRFSQVAVLKKARKEGVRFACRSGPKGCGVPALLKIDKRLQRGVNGTRSKPPQQMPVFAETVEFIGLQNDVPDDRKTCRAIAGHPALESWQYCGHPVMSPKISYCAVHAERFYNKAYLERLR